MTTSHESPPDFTYHDLGSWVWLAPRTQRARDKMRRHIYHEADRVITGGGALIDPERAIQIREILTVYEGYRVVKVKA